MGTRREHTVIDSSGRQRLKANGTILDMLPVGQALVITGALLVVLFTLVKPEASNGLNPPARILFWALHVGLGLGVLLMISKWLANARQLPGGTLAAVCITGLAGACIATPGYLLLDRLFADHVVDSDPDQPITGLVPQLFSELVQLGPWFLVAWLIINLPVLLPPPAGRLRLNDEVEHSPAKYTTNNIHQPAAATRIEKNKPPLQLIDLQSSSASTPVALAGQKFLLSLPGVVGTDVIAVSSDLHYLNVWTTAGRATVLGNLKDVVDELADHGMQVHRSHWVAHSHIRRIVGSASSAACIMSNELRVPVSRRKWKDVRAQYGRGVVHRSNTDVTDKHG